VEGGVNTCEANEGLATVPVLGNLEVGSVRADGVVAVVDERRVGGVGVTDVGVDRDSVTLEFHAGGDGNRAPVCVIEAGLIEVLGAIIRLADPVVLPIAVQQFEIGGAGALSV